jgi:hypothetical protein
MEIQLKHNNKVGQHAPICIQECALKIFFHTLSHIFCPKMCTLYSIYLGKRKAHVHYLICIEIYLFIKIWGTNKNIGNKSIFQNITCFQVLNPLVFCEKIINLQSEIPMTSCQTCLFCEFWVPL